MEYDSVFRAFILVILMGFAAGSWLPLTKVLLRGKGMTIWIAVAFIIAFVFLTFASSWTLNNVGLSVLGGVAFSSSFLTTGLIALLLFYHEGTDAQGNESDGLSLTLFVGSNTIGFLVILIAIYNETQLPETTAVLFLPLQAIALLIFHIAGHILQAYIAENKNLWQGLIVSVTAAVFTFALSFGGPWIIHFLTDLLY